MTLREVCGLTTEEIGRAYLIAPTTLAQRIVRAKAKIREAKIPYEVPEQHELPERLHTVLRVIYLVFNEGYSASSGDSVTRVDLSDEAIRLGRLLFDLLPEAEVQGLLALMLLHESRRLARMDDNGDLILLEDQDRSRWNRDLVQEGIALVEAALRSGRFGSYTLQAAIAAVHAEAGTIQQTDWPQIVALYDRLLELEPSPVIRLNRAVAVAMRDGPEAGLALINRLKQEEDLGDYYWLYAAEADLYRRLENTAEAQAAYRGSHSTGTGASLSTETPRGDWLKFFLLRCRNRGSPIDQGYIDQQTIKGDLYEIHDVNDSRRLPGGEETRFRFCSRPGKNRANDPLQ
jgi:RNA polymerase sigma-70 factor (ECF subfamily)